MRSEFIVCTSQQRRTNKTHLSQPGTHLGLASDISCQNPMAPPTTPRQSQPAPDSPRSSQSPPPSGLQGDLELELLGLANALYNLGTTVINDSTKERDKLGGGKQVGLRVYVYISPPRESLTLFCFLRNDVVSHLGTIDDMAQHISTMIPMQVLADIDNSRNPMQLTKDRLERAATENQFMNGKIAAIQVLQ